MKRKLIKSIIHKKINDWLSTMPEELRDAVKDKIIVTGGSIVSLLMNDKVNDYDLCFRDHGATKLIAEYYVKRFKDNPPPRFKDSPATVNIAVRSDEDRVKIVVKSAGVAGETEEVRYSYFESDTDPDAMEAHEYVERAMEVAKDSAETESDKAATKPKYRPVFLSSNAISLSDRIQIVIRFFGDPDVIHENYDFVHCMNYWTSWDNNLVLRPEALECVINKELRYHGSKYPLCSVIRTRKFIQRGWQINAGQYLKMLWQLQELDLSNISVLEDQLVGVDCAYFMEVIRLLKEHGNGKDIDATYLMEIIDKVF